MDKQSFEIVRARGAELLSYLEELSSLRIKVFRDYPYLYEGDFDYEKKYLQTYFQSNDSFAALCKVNNKIVGACTAIPLNQEEESFQKPFLQRGLQPKEILYFGESVLLKEYRGLGIGQAFIGAREDYAKSLLGIIMVVFCAVVREKNHPKQPKDYRALDEFWRKNGYAPLDGLTTTYSWKEIGEKEESPKKMQFWMKKL